MIKIITTALIVCCCLASSAYAETTAEISGEYSVTGTYMDQQNIQYQYYSHELDLYAKIMNEGTILSAEFGITDKTWGDETIEDTGAEFELDRAWLTHGFENGLKLEVGKMTGGVWGTMLGDEELGFYRVQGTKSFGDTAIIAYVQKDVENGSTHPTVDDDEKDDSDTISGGFIHQIGDIKLMPMFVYAHDSNAVPTDQDTAGTQELILVFAALGTVGAVNFETEINYIDFYSDLAGTSDYSLINFWADVNVDFGSVKTGISLAYGTEDKGEGKATFGVDFAPMILMDNDEDDGIINDLGAMMLGKIYASAEPFEKLTTGCAFAYGNYEEKAHASKINNTRLFEFDLTADYAITKALKYSVGFAYADVESDYDVLMQVEHELVFSF